MKRKDGRSLSSTAQAALRQQAARAVMAGTPQGEVARGMGVSKQVISRWVCRARRGGPVALQGRRRGRPPGGRLKPWQSATSVRLITDRCPDQLKLPFALWTREAVRDLIARKFGLQLSVWTMGRALKQWGFTPQKPVRRAYERDPVAVRRWLTEEYPWIRQAAKRERAEIYWGDAMGMRSDHAAGRSYGWRGQTPVLPGTGQRFRCNMLSAITNRGHLNFKVFRKKFVAPVFIEFLNRLVRQVKRHIFLIMDRHPVHRAQQVQVWCKAHARRCRLFLLPAYSPELNPDELVNQDVKTNAVGRKRPRHVGELMHNVRSYLWGRQRHPELVKHYFSEPHVIYAAQ